MITSLVLSLGLALSVSARAAQCDAPLKSPRSSDERWAQLVKHVQTKGQRLNDQQRRIIVELKDVSGDPASGYVTNYLSAWGGDNLYQVGLVSETWRDAENERTQSEQLVMVLTPDGKLTDKFWRKMRAYKGQTQTKEEPLEFSEAEAEAKSDELLRLWFCVKDRGAARPL